VAGGLFHPLIAKIPQLLHLLCPHRPRLLAARATQWEKAAPTTRPPSHPVTRISYQIRVGTRRMR